MRARNASLVDIVENLGLHCKTRDHGLDEQLVVVHVAPRHHAVVGLALHGRTSFIWIAKNDGVHLLV